MSDNRPSVLDRAALDQVAAEAMADRAVDLQAVWALAAEHRQQRRRRIRRTAAALGSAAALAGVAVLLLSVLVPGLHLGLPQPAEVPAGPGKLPASVGIAPPWTPSITDRPLSRVAVAVGWLKSGDETKDAQLPDRLVVVGADDGAQRFLPDSDGEAGPVAISPDGSLVAWASTAPGPDDARGVIDVVEVSTGVRGRIWVPGLWHRGVRIQAITFSPDGGSIVVGTEMYVDRWTPSAGASWLIPVQAGAGVVRGGAPQLCAATDPDDGSCNPVPPDQVVGELAGLVATTSFQARVAAAAAEVVAAGQSGERGPGTKPGRAGRDVAWYPWAARQAGSFAWDNGWAVPLGLVLVLGWVLLRPSGGTRESVSLPDAEDTLDRALPEDRAIPEAPAAIEGRAGPRGRVVSILVVVAVSALVVVGLGATAATGWGLPDVSGDRGRGRPVVPAVITAPHKHLKPAFVRAGEPGVTAVSMVKVASFGDESRLVGLSAATGEWTDLTSLPGVGQSAAQRAPFGAIAVSPNGRYVAAAPTSEFDLDRFVVIDLKAAQVHTFRLPFGADIPPETTRSAGPLAVLDDGSLAVVRINNQALFLVSPSGVRREITSVGKVDAVSAQSGGRVMLWRGSNPEARNGGRLDILDSGSGRVVAAVTGTGHVTVAAWRGPDAVAWRLDAQGENQLVPLFLGPGTDPEPAFSSAPGAWNSPGGVEALWSGRDQSGAGILVGSGWSDRRADTLLRTLPGGHDLQPLAPFEGEGWRSASVSVAGSVVADATVVEPAKRPWWSRTVWSVIDRF